MESLPPKPPLSLPSSSTTWNSKPIIDSGERNWLDLPQDAVLSIFRKLDTIDLLVRAHNVCTTWRKISKDPFLFRTINMPNLGEPDYQLDLETLCQRAVDYSSGHIIDINIEYFGTDDLLHRIANSYVPLFSTTFSFFNSQLYASLWLCCFLIHRNNSWYHPNLSL